MVKRKSKKEKPKVFFDIETTPIGEGETIDFRCAVFVPSGSDTPIYCRTEKEALDCIFVHFEGCAFYAHNGGGFDYVWLVDGMIRHGIKKEIQAAQIGSKILFMKIDESDFFDTFWVMPSKLESLGLSFLGEGKKGEFSEQNIDRLLEYCYQDVLLLKRIYYAFQEKINNLFGCDISITAASTAFKAFSSISNVKTYCKDDANEWIRDYYFGGRCETFRKGSINGAINVYDVNSLYPSCMLDDVPYGTPRCLMDSRKNNIIMTDFYFCEVDAPDGIGLLPVGRDKLYFPHGRFWGCWSGLELMMFEELGGKIITIENRLAYQKAPIFREYVQKLYAVRQKAKDQNDEGLDVTAKILLNSLYGKFGQINERQGLIITPFGCDEDMRLGGRDGWSYYAAPTAINNYHQSVATSAYITSKARCILLDAIAQNIENVLYCDTDSIHVLGEAVGIEVDKSKLGAWKHEGVFDSATYYTQKMYALYRNGEKIKSAHKGFATFPEDIDYVEHKNRVSALKTAINGGFRTIKAQKSIKDKTEKRVYISGKTATTIHVDKLPQK